MWISLSNSSPSMAAMKMNCLSSYRRPNTKWLMEYWYIFCRVCSLVEWIKRETEWNRRFWLNISGFLSMKAVMQMLFSSDSQQLCGAEQPSTHSLERRWRTSAVRSRTVGFVGCLTWHIVWDRGEEWAHNGQLLGTTWADPPPSSLSIIMSLCCW